MVVVVWHRKVETSVLKGYFSFERIPDLLNFPKIFWKINVGTWGKMPGKQFGNRAGRRAGGGSLDVQPLQISTFDPLHLRGRRGSTSVSVQMYT